MLKRNRKNISRLVSYFALIAAAFSLVCLFLLSVGPVLIAAWDLYHGNATEVQKLLLVCSSSLAVLITLLINYIVRTAAIENAVLCLPQSAPRIEHALEKFSIELDALKNQVLELGTPKSEELLRDTDELWGRLCGKTTIFAPTLKHEVWLVGGATNSTRRFEVSKARIAVFSNRIRQGDLEIIIPTGVINRPDPNSNVLLFDKSGHDLELILKLAKLLYEIKRTGSVDMSRVKIYFASKSDPEQRSVFLSHLAEAGKLQPTVMLYGKGWDSLTHDVNRRVEILRKNSDVLYFRSLVHSYRNNSTRWTVDQLLLQLSGFFSVDDEAVLAPPDSFRFDPDKPFSSSVDFDIIDNEDASVTFPDEKPTSKKS